jgi:hypothetical protein
LGVVWPKGLCRSGGRFAERPSERGRGRYRKRRPIVMGSLGALLESAGSRRLPRVYLYTVISIAPRYNSPLKTAGVFEPEQISIDVTVMSSVSVPTFVARNKLWKKARNGRR